MLGPAGSTTVSDAAMPRWIRPRVVDLRARGDVGADLHDEAADAVVHIGSRAQVAAAVVCTRGGDIAARTGPSTAGRRVGRRRERRVELQLTGEALGSGRVSGASQAVVGSVLAASKVAVWKPSGVSGQLNWTNAGGHLHRGRSVSSWEEVLVLVVVAGRPGVIDADLQRRGRGRRRAEATTPIVDAATGANAAETLIDRNRAPMSFPLALKAHRERWPYNRFEPYAWMYDLTRGRRAELSRDLVGPPARGGATVERPARCRRCRRYARPPQWSTGFAPRFLHRLPS